MPAIPYLSHVACFIRTLLAAVAGAGTDPLLPKPGRGVRLAITAFVSMSGRPVTCRPSNYCAGATHVDAMWREKYGFPPPLIASQPGPTPWPYQSIRNHGLISYVARSAISAVLRFVGGEACRAGVGKPADLHGLSRDRLQHAEALGPDNGLCARFR